ncbi:MAG: hypothetical protein M3N53_11820 [Actinomycetota bacterium]|nr:hypothetical protein [Actinomycetota bacterium]
MRKSIVIGLAALMAASILAPASAGKAKKQEVSGIIAAPARHPDGCYTGLSRHLFSLGGANSNGAVGWTFDVDKGTWKKPFVLEATGGAGVPDLDLTYYLGDFATQQEFVNDPLPAPPATAEFHTHDGPGEAGVVPVGAIKAIVCIYASENGAAAAVPFTYTAGKGVKAPKG